MEQMSSLRFVSTAATGAFAGWGVGKLYSYMYPAFHIDPRALAIAATVGALFNAAAIRFL